MKLNTTFIESLVLGGSAYVSGEFQPDDQIVEIDGKSVTPSSDIHAARCGCDIPGSQVSLVIRRADSVRLGSLLSPNPRLRY